MSSQAKGEILGGKLDADHDATIQVNQCGTGKISPVGRNDINTGIMFQVYCFRPTVSGLLSQAYFLRPIFSGLLFQA